MKKLTAVILALTLLGHGCGSSPPAETGSDSVLRVGMEFKEAEKILQNWGAQPVVLQIEPKKSSEGKYLQLDCYGLDRKPAIVINHEPVNGNNIIRGLSLNYTYENKGDPKNRWLDVEEIDLKRIGF